MRCFLKVKLYEELFSFFLSYVRTNFLFFQFTGSRCDIRFLHCCFYCFLLHQNTSRHESTSHKKYHSNNFKPNSWMDIRQIWNPSTSSFLLHRVHLQRMVHHRNTVSIRIVSKQIWFLEIQVSVSFLITFIK